MLTVSLNCASLSSLPLRPYLSSHGPRINLQTVAFPWLRSPGASPHRAPHWGGGRMELERCFYPEPGRRDPRLGQISHRNLKKKRKTWSPDQLIFLWVLGVFCSMDSLVFAVSHKHISVIDTVNLLHLKFTVNDLFPRIQETERGSGF